MPEEIPEGSTPAEVPTLYEVISRLDRMEKQLDTISAQVCPVCGPQVTREKHPDYQTNGQALTLRDPLEQ